MQLSKEEKIELTKKFRTSDSDTGSPEYQVALTTAKIRNLTEHLQKNKHDFLAKRGVQIAVSKRRALLKHLKAENAEAYGKLIKSLGLRG